MSIMELIALFQTNRGNAAKYVVELITEGENTAKQIAAQQYSETPELFTNDDAGRKRLADEVFGAFKHYLRGKIEFAVDIAWIFSEVRGPLRAVANEAAKDELASAHA